MQVGVGPQHREFRKEILQAMRVGVWASNKEADVKSAYNNVQVGGGANTENFEKKFYRQCELGWDDDKEILFYRN